MKTKLMIAAIAALGATAVYADGHFNKADADADGVVTMAEFEAAHAARVAERFARMDKNADGVLSEDEMQRPERGERRKGKRRGKVNPEKVVERMDADGSGSLSFEELQGKRFSPDIDAFTAADIDGNSELDAAELKAMMKARRAERRQARQETDE